VFVNFREFVMDIIPCPGTGEDHDHLIPRIVRVIHKLLRLSEYKDIFKLLKCDGYKNNALLAEYLTEILLELEEINSKKNKYCYKMQDWCQRLYVIVLSIVLSFVLSYISIYNMLFYI